MIFPVLIYMYDDGSGALIIVGAVNGCDREDEAARIMECDAGAFIDEEPECDNDCDA